jgi:beta-galactosidase
MLNHLCFRSCAKSLLPLSNTSPHLLLLLLSMLLPPRSVEALHVPYVYPQEAGGRADVTWLSLQRPAAGQQPSTITSTTSSSSGGGAGPSGVLLAPWGSPGATSSSSNSGSGSGGAQSSWQASVSPYSWQALQAAGHQNEMLPDPQLLHVHLDVGHMGVGGDDSWSPSVHEKYMVSPGHYSCQLAVAPVWAGADVVAAAAQLLKGQAEA